MFDKTGTLEKDQKAKTDSRIFCSDSKLKRYILLLQQQLQLPQANDKESWDTWLNGRNIIIILIYMIFFPPTEVI